VVRHNLFPGPSRGFPRINRESAIAGLYASGRQTGFVEVQGDKGTALDSVSIAVISGVRQAVSLSRGYISPLSPSPYPLLSPKTYSVSIGKVLLLQGDFKLFDEFNMFVGRKRCLGIVGVLVEGNL
jgi:hypothetical protein